MSRRRSSPGRDLPSVGQCHFRRPLVDARALPGGCRAFGDAGTVADLSVAAAVLVRVRRARAADVAASLTCRQGTRRGVRDDQTRSNLDLSDWAGRKRRRQIEASDVEWGIGARAQVRTLPRLSHSGTGAELRCARDVDAREVQATALCARWFAVARRDLVEDGPRAGYRRGVRGPRVNPCSLVAPSIATSCGASLGRPAGGPASRPVRSRRCCHRGRPCRPFPGLLPFPDDRCSAAASL